MQHGRHGMIDWEQTITFVASMYAQKKRLVCQFCTFPVPCCPTCFQVTFITTANKVYQDLLCKCVNDLWTAVWHFVHAYTQDWEHEHLSSNSCPRLVSIHFLRYRYSISNAQIHCSMILFSLTWCCFDTIYAWQHMPCMVSPVEHRVYPKHYAEVFCNLRTILKEWDPPSVCILSWLGPFQWFTRDTRHDVHKDPWLLWTLAIAQQKGWQLKYRCRCKIADKPEWSPALLLPAAQASPCISLVYSPGNLDMWQPPGVS